MNKRLIKIKQIIINFTIIIITMIALDKPIYADVGSFEDYDSGSDWGSSDWDSGSDWSSSTWDSDYYDYGGSSSGGGSFVVFITELTVIVIVVIIVSKFKSGNRRNRTSIDFNQIQNRAIYEDKQVENIIKQTDPNFNTEDFISFAKEVFIKLQNAWTDRDWEKIRPFESKELFEQHKAQLEGYIRNNQINVMERISVNWVHLLTFEQYAGKDILKVDLNSRMGDYIIDATTKKVVKGNKTREYYHTYTLTFIRTTGNITQTGKDEFTTTNCPNCGAPTRITSSGKCEYCDSVITTEDHGWVLSNLTRKN